MSLSLSCACGARFEVEETVARQTVSCPECQRGLQVPSLERAPPRTSGYALASTILALVLMFTGIGTILAVVLGLVGLLRISRQRGRIVGTGYALFGILWGLLFTALFAFAVLQGELFGLGDAVRERIIGGEVERDGPLEVKRPGNGYAITRASPRWTVATPALAEKLTDNRTDLVLVNLSRDAYIDIGTETLGADTSFDDYRESVLDRFREGRQKPENFGKFQTRFTNLRVRRQERLPATEDVENAEILLDVKMSGVPLTYLLRMVHPRGSDTVYLIYAWSNRRKFPGLEPEFRQCLDSFRLLHP